MRDGERHDGNFEQEILSISFNFFYRLFWQLFLKLVIRDINENKVLKKRKQSFEANGNIWHVR